MLPDIAILSPFARSAGPAHGGITPVVTALAGGLCAAGAGVELVTFARGDPRARLPAPHPRLTVHNLGPGRRWQHARRLQDYLAERRPQALLAAGHRANLLAAGRAGGAGRVVLSVHNTLTPGLHRLGPLRRALRLRALRAWYPRADAIVCVSAGVAADLIRLVPHARERVAICHNPIDGTRTEPAAGLHPWLADGDGTVIIGAGRLTVQKDFATLIAAFARLEQRPPPRLMILGEGPERARLERLAARLGVAERVALPGFVPNPRAHMAAAALFVLSSRWEGFGNVLVEAMAAGTPVVATDCPSGPGEILEGGALGALVPVADAAALAEAMHHALQAPKAAQRLRERAADFAPERVAKRYLELLLPVGKP